MGEAAAPTNLNGGGTALLVRLRPVTPWRIGPDSGNRDRVDRIYHSDSLYSAITGTMASLGLLEEWLDATARGTNEPAVRFSSCFPFQGNNLYVVPPRHVWPPAPSPKVRWKSARFVPMRAVEKLLTGESLSEDAWLVDSASESLIPTSAPTGIFRASVRSSAAIDRGGDGAVAHSTACLEFAPQCGLWFVAVFKDATAKEEWRDRLQGAIRLLADSGFGGERSRGWGRAETPEFREGKLDELLTAPAVSGESVHWLLSLFHPSETDEIDWSHGNYTVTTRTGRIESPAQWGDAKKASRMVSEGSVLSAPSLPRGSVVDIAPEGFPHPVYRAGLALTIAVPRTVVRSAQ